MKSQQSARKAGGVSAIIGGGPQLFSTSTGEENSSNQHTGSVQNPSTITPGKPPR